MRPPVVSRLLREAPNIKILVTTRIVLRVYGEREFPVPPLGLPPADAGRLTADRGDALRGGRAVRRAGPGRRSRRSR